MSAESNAKSSINEAPLLPPDRSIVVVPRAASQDLMKQTRDQTTGKRNVSAADNTNHESSKYGVDQKKEPAAAYKSDGKQQPDTPKKRKSITTDDAMYFELGLGLPVPSNRDDLVDDINNEADEEQQRRRANFAASRQQHVLANNLQARYEAILAAADDDRQPQPQQDITVFHLSAKRPERNQLKVAMELFRDDENENDTEEYM